MRKRSRAPCQVSFIKMTLSIMTLSVVTYAIFAQGRTSTQAGCGRVDANKGLLFISFERAGEGEPNNKGESRQRVWLRLHNNTTCTIFIPTASAKLTRFPDGQITFDLQEGAEIIVDYDVVDTRRGKAPTPAYPRGDSGGALSHLPAGRSVLFSVPITLFKKQLDVAVPFIYEWEGIGTPGQGSVVHRVYFNSDNLPKELLQQAKQ